MKFRNDGPLGYDENFSQFLFFAKPGGSVELTWSIIFPHQSSSLSTVLRFFCDDNPPAEKEKIGKYTREATCVSRNLNELHSLYEIITQNNTIQCGEEIQKLSSRF